MDTERCAFCGEFGICDECLERALEDEYDPFDDYDYYDYDAE